VATEAGLRLLVVLDSPSPHNAQFPESVKANGHRTEAERFGRSFVFMAFLHAGELPPTRGMVSASWSRQVEGADWAHPDGPHSTIGGSGRSSVVHVSWNDE
jgi:formylglycine-generating enzyme required for sulfatase activity